MSTEGFGATVSRWENGFKAVDIPGYLMKHDHIFNLGYAGPVSNKPLAAKVERGYLASAAIQPSQAMSFTGDVDDAGSDMDLSSGSEDEIHGRRFSVLSSPQDDKVPIRFGGKVAGKTTPQAGYLGVESLDSATSTEVSFGQSRCDSDNDRGFQRGRNIAEVYSATSTSLGSIGMIEKQDVWRRQKNMKLVDDEVPSDPLFVGSPLKFHQVSNTRMHGGHFPDNSNGSTAKNCLKESDIIDASTTIKDYTGNGNSNQPVRNVAGVDNDVSQKSLPAQLPTFHASQQGIWYALISYESCVRLCLQSWTRDHCSEAPYFLNDECALLRDAFGLQQALLPAEEELLARQHSQMVSTRTAPKFVKTSCKIKVQVRKVHMGLHPPTSCSFSSLKSLNLGSHHVSDLKSTLHSGWEDIKKVRVTPYIAAHSSIFNQSLAYAHASCQYIRQVSRHLKSMVSTMYKASNESLQETYTCMLRLKSSCDSDAVQMLPGSGETRIFFPDGLSDDLVVEVQNSNGQQLGCVVVQVAALTHDLSNRSQWWPIYHEPEHELVGRLQLIINYSTGPVENYQPKCGSVAETVAYDLVLEVAMKIQKFQQRNLLLHGPWKWLVTKFASHYGIPDAYTKLRYLSYVMDVATPTEDCLSLVCDLLSPLFTNGKQIKTLSHQEKRMLGEIESQVHQMLALVFEHYKSLDESSPSGMKDVHEAATGIPASALTPAVKLYTLLHDISSPEAQLKLCRYFQVVSFEEIMVSVLSQQLERSAIKKRSRMHLAEVDELIYNNGTPVDHMILSTHYQKMKSIVFSIRNEIVTDIEIHNRHVLPSFVDLPNLSSSIYSVDLSSRVREFLTAWPPPAPLLPIAELLLSTADFQKDLACWNISPVRGGLDAKQLFHSYINIWIQDKRLHLLESCKLEQVKCSSVRTQQSTSPFVDDMYDQLIDMLKEYEIIIVRWPEYIHLLEIAIGDVEKAILEALDRQYADVLSPLKDTLAPKTFGFKYMQKISKRSVNMYFVPDELGILLNSIKRILDVLHPKMETHLISWSSGLPDDGKYVIGECLTEVSILLRTKFRSYVQATEEKLAENTRLQSTTRLKKIIQEVNETAVESEIRSRLQPLKDLVIETIDRLQAVVTPHLFIAICRGFWDRLGQDLLHVLEDKTEKIPWFKGLRIVVSVLDDIFISEMQKFLGNALQEKDLEPPRFIMEVQCMLNKDAASYKDNYFY